MPAGMRQITFSITPFSEYGWMGGLALNEYVGKKASYTPLNLGGMDPFRKIGVLQGGAVPSLATSFVTQAINAFEAYTASGALRLYGNGVAGAIYQLDTSNHTNVSLLASLANNNLDYGFAIARNTLFAAYNPTPSLTYLSRITALSDATPTLNISFNVSMISQVKGVQIKHVIMPWKANVYCMHANNIDYLDGNGVSTGIFTVGARLPTDMVIKTATPYGDKIVIGASDNLIASAARGTQAKVYFYDGISNDWQKEIPFPENDILNLGYVNGELLAWGAKWLYRYNASSGQFEPIQQIDVTPSFNSAFNRMHSANDGVVHFTGSNVVRAYGSPVDYIPKANHVPFTGVGIGGACKWVTNDRIYVSKPISGGSPNGGQLVYINVTDSSAEIGVDWRSRFISFDGVKFRVAWMRVVTDPLSSGDVLTLIARNVAGTTATLGTMTFAVDGAVASKEFNAANFTEDLGYLTEFQIIPTLTAGVPKLRRIDFILETANEY